MCIHNGRACCAMGNNVCGVWTGAVFDPPRLASTRPSSDGRPKKSSRISQASKHPGASKSRRNRCGHDDRAEPEPTIVFVPQVVDSATPGSDLERFRICPSFENPADPPPKTMCKYTDEACLWVDSKALAPTGRHAFVFNSGCNGTVGHVPEAQEFRNRADLRKIIAALNFKSWWEEDWQRIVLVTASQDVAANSTARLRERATREWRTTKRRPVTNEDLWKTLSDIMGAYAKKG